MKTYLKMVRKKNKPITLTLSCTLIYLVVHWHLLSQALHEVLKMQSRRGSLTPEITPSGTRVIDYKDDGWCRLKQRIPSRGCDVQLHLGGQQMTSEPIEKQLRLGVYAWRKEQLGHGSSKRTQSRLDPELSH